MKDERLPLYSEYAGLKKGYTYLLLGSNLGDREKFLEEAILLLSEKAGKIISWSSVYETEPWGFETQNSFLNRVILVQTDLMPEELLHVILEIERVMGRKRVKEGYDSRIIDIDILFYDDLISHTDDLTIPHPRMHLRRFTLIPMEEIAPDFMHPLLRKTMSELLKDCEDQGKASLYSS